VRCREVMMAGQVGEYHLKGLYIWGVVCFKVKVWGFIIFGGVLFGGKLVLRKSV